MDQLGDPQARLDEISARRAEWNRNAEARRRRSRRLYSDEHGRPVLRRSFVLYLDELGTKARTPELTNEQLRQSIAEQDRLTSFLDATDFWADDEVETGRGF